MDTDVDTESTAMPAIEWAKASVITAMFGISRSHLKRLAIQRKIECRRIGRCSKVFEIESVRRYLREQPR